MRPKKGILSRAIRGKGGTSDGEKEGQSRSLEGSFLCREPSLVEKRRPFEEGGKNREVGKKTIKRIMLVPLISREKNAW